MLFREVAGTGYWGAGLLAIMCGLTVAARRSAGAQSLLILLIAIPAVCAFGADAGFDYFVAARQFVWVVPALAILATGAIERNTRTGLMLTVLLGVVCLWQNVRFYTTPREDWQLAARALAEEVRRGACLVVVPADQAMLYELFEPQLRPGDCETPHVVLANTPYSNSELRAATVAGLAARGYRPQSQVLVGKSEIVSFRHRQ